MTQWDAFRVVLARFVKTGMPGEKGTTKRFLGMSLDCSR